MTNPLRALGSLALCVPLVLLGACASADKPKPVVVQSVIQAPGQAHVTVSNASDGASVLLDATQELRVELVLSSWEVANNMDWSVTDLKPGVLTVLGSRFDRGSRDVNPLESEGSRVWRFKAQAPGTVRLTFGLRRPYGLGAPPKSVGFDVTVR
ncbi:MAG: protease inhibitor I42 family protein [Pseudomonadota bacterium]